jgi:hypothetical protein
LKLGRAAILAMVVLAMPSAAAADSRSDQLDGRAVISLIDDFLRFWEQARGTNLSRARRLWIKLVETKHRDYFERAVYRGASRQERRAMLNGFLLAVPARVEAIRQFRDSAQQQVLEGVLNFKARFPEYRQRRDIYLGFSFFQFDGAVRPLSNDLGLPDTLCLAAEVISTYSHEQIQILLAHELFHLYHFSFLFRPSFHFLGFGIAASMVSAEDLATAHIPLMVEGMAVAASEAVYPGRPRELYLNLAPEELKRQLSELAQNSFWFLTLMRIGAPPEIYWPWFARSDFQHAPPRGGYLLGYEVIRRLLPRYSLEQMARMAPAQLREYAEEELEAIALGSYQIMASAQ